MKIKRHYDILSGISNQPLAEISSNDVAGVLHSVHLAELDSRRDQIYAALDSARCQPQGSCSAFNTNQFRSPTILWCKKIGQPFQSQRNTLRRQTLINLSYSQPSSPKTPLQKRTYLVAATPLMKMPASSYAVDNFVICTPMVNNALEMLNGQMRSSHFESFPDILEIIDDDSKTVMALDREIHSFTDMDLTDENVIDYLLDISHEVISDAHTSSELKVEVSEDNLTVRRKRKCARAKPMSMEEAKSIRRIQKEREKEKRKQRKERFKKEVKGTRRSRRTKSTVHYF